nr:uncharacterized protein LOC109400387 [Aedes albopictus]
MGKIFLDHIGGQKLYLVRRLRNQSDQQTGTYQHPIHGGHWKGLPVQTGRQFDLLSGAGPSHADRTPHGPGRDVQELQGQARMDVRICYGGVPEIQEGRVILEHALITESEGFPEA